MDTQQTPNGQEPVSKSSDEQPVVATPQTPFIPEPKRSKKKWWLAVAALLLLAVAAGLCWYFINLSQPAQQTSSTQNTTAPKMPTYSRLVLFSKEFSVEAFDPGTSKVIELYKATDAELKFFCGSGCSGRFISSSPDYSKIAFDSMIKDNKAAFGYYDRATQKVTVVANGSKPWWSPDGTKIAFTDENGVNVITLATGAVITIDNTKPQLNKEFGTAFPPLIFGWKSNTELVFDSQRDPNDIVFNIGNINTKANHEVTVQGITAQDSVRGGILSPDSSKMLIHTDKDPGYDVAVINIDGTGLVGVTGNSAARWPGSGYDSAGFSPDGQTALIVNGFIPANPTPAQGRSTGELEAHDLKGQKLFTVAGSRVINGTHACWYDEDHIYGLFGTDQSKYYLGVYDKTSNKVTELDSTVSGIGLSSLTCAK